MFNFFKKSAPSTANTALEQNIFDNEVFFDGYQKLRDSDTNSNDLLEQPALRKLMPELTDKTVLDLGCGYGHNCIEFVQKGACRGTLASMDSDTFRKWDKNHRKILEKFPESFTIKHKVYVTYFEMK